MLKAVNNLWKLGFSDGRERDLFPLPFLCSEFLGRDFRLSRKSLVRLRSRLGINGRINTLVSALNVLANGGAQRNCAMTDFEHDTYRSICEVPFAGQRDVLQRLRDIVFQDVVPDSLPDPTEACRELLKEKVGGYFCGSRGAVAPFREGAVSLKSDMTKGVFLVDVLPNEWRSLFDDPSKLLRPHDEAAFHREELGVSPYFDVELERDESLYAGFLADMHQGGMLDWELDPVDYTAPFFVNKDDEGCELRALFDLRAPNTSFFDPPKVSMLTPEGMSRFELDEHEYLYATGYDLRDYYHYMIVPPWVRVFFGLPKVTYELVNRALQKRGHAGLDGTFGKFSGSPCLKTLPMGWKWSVLFAQVVHENMLRKAVPTLEYITDKQVFRPFSLEGGGNPEKAFAYIDDGGVFSTCPESANVSHAKILDAVRKEGFFDHERKGHLATTNWEKLGIGCLNGTLIVPKSKRRWRLEIGTRLFLRRALISVKHVEILVGHFIYFFMLRRPLLSVFHFVYEFIHHGPRHRCVLPREVREEFEIAIACLPFAFVDMKTPFSDIVYASDSSLTHYCVMRTRAPVESVKGAYRMKERWRFLDHDPDLQAPEIEYQSNYGQDIQRNLGLTAIHSSYVFEGWGPRPGDLVVGELQRVRRSLEVFSGGAHWSNALENLGWETHTIEILDNEDENILNDAYFEKVLKEVGAGFYSVVHLGTPCRTWSRARQPALRDSNKFLLSGFPGLSARRLDLVREGNELLRRSLVILNFACAVGAGVTIENPESSLLWLHPGVRRWLRDWECKRITTHYCRFGCAFVKPTSIAGNIDGLDRLAKLCTRDHVHEILRGKDKDGHWKTKKAAMYPRLLCALWADVVDEDFSIRLSSEESCFSIPEHTTPHQLRCLNDRFQSLPLSVVENCDYKTMFVHKWLKEEAIHMLEGRATLKALHHACRCPDLRGHRLLFLCDNMSVVMALNKGRAKDYRLLRITRRVSALVLACGILAQWRYIESKRNPADGPTRP